MNICSNCRNLICEDRCDEVQWCDKFIPAFVGSFLEERMKNLEQIVNKQEERIRCLEKKFEKMYIIEEEKVEEVPPIF